MSLQSTSRPPVELWFVVVGFGIYSLVPFLPQVPRLPSNPVGVFVVAAVLNLMMARSVRAYWATVALGLLTLWFPIITSSAWLTALPGRRSLAEVYWVFLVPATLLCLLFTSRVRRFSQAPAELDGEKVEPEA